MTINTIRLYRRLIACALYLGMLTVPGLQVIHAVEPGHEINQENNDVGQELQPVRVAGGQNERHEQRRARQRELVRQVDAPAVEINIHNQIVQVLQEMPPHQRQYLAAGAGGMLIDRGFLSAVYTSDSFVSYVARLVILSIICYTAMQAYYSVKQIERRALSAITRIDGALAAVDPLIVAVDRISHVFKSLPTMNDFADTMRVAEMLPHVSDLERHYERELPVLYALEYCKSGHGQELIKGVVSAVAEGVLTGNAHVPYQEGGLIAGIVDQLLTKNAALKELIVCYVEAQAQASRNVPSMFSDRAQIENVVGATLTQLVAHKAELIDAAGQILRGVLSRERSVVSEVLGVVSSAVQGQELIERIRGKEPYDQAIILIGATLMGAAHRLLGV